MLSPLSNAYSREGTCSATTSIDFPWRTRQIVVTNSSLTNNLVLGITGNNITLGPTESLSANIWINKMTLAVVSAADVNFRVWAFG